MQKEVDAAIGLFPLSMLFMIGCTVLLFIYCKPVPSLKLGNRLLATCSNIISLALSFAVLYPHRAQHRHASFFDPDH